MYIYISDESISLEYFTRSQKVLLVVAGCWLVVVVVLLLLLLLLAGGGGGLVLVSAGHGGLCYCDHPESQADHKNTNPQFWMIKIPIRFPT